MMPQKSLNAYLISAFADRRLLRDFQKSRFEMFDKIVRQRSAASVKHNTPFKTRLFTVS